MGTDYASQALRAQTAVAVASKTSFAVIFVDLAQAFHTTSRMSLCGDRWTSCQRKIGMQCHLLNSDIGQRCISLVLHRMFRMRRILVFVQRKGQLPDRTVVRSRRGTRPGTPAADIAFTAVMAKVLCCLNQDLKDVLDSPDQPKVPPIVWMDDLAIMVQDKDAGSLIDKVADVMATIHDRMREHGWRINYKKGKTKVLLRLAGA